MGYIGQSAWNKGKKMSDGMREKMRQNKKGNKNRVGKFHSVETRAKISASRTGKSVGENHHAWKGGTPARIQRHNKTRKENMKRAGGFHSEYEWELLKTQYNHTCPSCGDSTKPLTKDHIIPVSKGGSNNIENIQPLCKRCNSRKHTKETYYKL